MANLSPVEILFHEASKTGDLTQMKNVITKVINSKDDAGKTPLHNAAQKGNFFFILHFYFWLIFSQKMQIMPKNGENF